MAIVASRLHLTWSLAQYWSTLNTWEFPKIRGFNIDLKQWGFM